MRKQSQILRYFLPTDIRKTKDENGNEKHEFVISDSTLDRYGTVIPISAWNLENYDKNGIVAYQHETSSWDKPDPDYIIGKGKAWIEDNTRLVGSVEYEPADLNPLADKIRRKVEFGTLSSTSVGFRHIRGHWGEENRGENPDVYYFDEVDLLEFSIVNIPANPNAVKRAIAEHIHGIIMPEEPDADLNDTQPDTVVHNGKILQARAWLTLHRSGRLSY